MRAALLATLLLGTTPALAQTADEVTSSDGVVITGELETMERRTRTYVDGAAGRRRSGQLPRWNGPLCLAIGGLTHEQEQFIGGTVRTVGNTVGIPVALGNDCDRMAVLIFTETSERLLGRMRETNSRMLSAWNRHRQRLLAESPDPVRWLAFAELGQAQGGITNRDAQGFSGQAGQGPRSFAKSHASRLSSSTVADQKTLFVLVDATRLNGVSNRALANYLAMVVLGGPDPARPPPAPSILQLFDEGAERTDVLTEWDRTYLVALYSSGADTNAVLQEREVARRMARTLLKMPAE